MNVFLLALAVLSQHVGTAAIAYAGGTARLGDRCWGSPGTIAGFVGPTLEPNRIYDIATVRFDRPDGAGYPNAGYMYQIKDGRQFFQSTQGSRITPITISRRVLSAGSEPQNAIVRMDIRVAFSDRHSRAILMPEPGELLARAHVRRCFAHPWDGRADA